MINWKGEVENPPSFYTFTNKSAFDQYVAINTDIYLADLPSKIVGGKLVLCVDPIVTKDKTFNVVGAWFDINQPAYIDDNGVYCARPWGFIALPGHRGLRSRLRSPSWQMSAALRNKLLASKGAVVDYRELP